MDISQAVIAAAGRGTRFLPCTKTTPKELLPLWDRPVIQHLVEEIAAAGIPEVIVVTRPGTDAALRSYFSHSEDWDSYLAVTGKTHLLAPLYKLLDGLRLSFVSQPPDLPYGNGAPILAARPLLTGPFAYLYGDDIVLEPQKGASLRALIELFEERACAAVVGAFPVAREAVSAVGSIAYHPKAQHKVDYIVEKPDPDEAPSLLTPIGRQVLATSIIQVLEDQAAHIRPGQELWMTDALSTLARGNMVLAPRILGEWMTTGDPVNLMKASLAFAQFRPATDV
jgi:UTP--glucose-1-phosphate uridylyltransferase